MRERSVGLGVMGFHSFLQARGLPFEGAMAKSWNLRIFKHIRAQVDEASMMLAQERGPRPTRLTWVMEVQLQDGDARPRRSDHRRRHRSYRADPGQHLHHKTPPAASIKNLSKASPRIKNSEMWTHDPGTRRMVQHP
jgi:ribonucleotide reductase alpha subunit